jgi:4a-hydroxytetrahydrobiopterin dehydratase
MQWLERNNHLVKTFTFSKFVNAFAFMTEVANLAKKMSHHAWGDNKSQSVTIRVKTPGESEGITEKDHSVAELIDEIYIKMRK